MKIAKLLPLVVISLTLSACAGGPKVRIDDNVRQSIKTVAIDAAVDLPDTVHFNGATQNISANFGLIGMFIGGNDKKNKTRTLEAAMEKQELDVSAIVYQKFSQEMALRTPYKPLKQDSASDATMSIDVHLYGLEGVGTHMYPQLTVSAEMKDSAGKTIWRNRGTVGPFENKNQAKYTFDELIARPARLTEIMTSAATIAAEKVMADL